MYQSPAIKHAKSQEELEQLANKEKEAQISERHLNAAQRGYYSSTDHGRKILNDEAVEGSGLRWVDLLQLKITQRREEVAANRRKPDWFKLMANFEKCVDMALSVSRTYSQGGTALDIAGWITLKSVVDGFGGNSSTNDWPVAASVAQRIGKAVELQMLDAATFAAVGSQVEEKDGQMVRKKGAVDEYRAEAKRWTRANQSGSNKSTNIAMGQKALLESVGFDRDQMRWTQKQRNAVGWFLLDTCSQIGLCEQKQVLREEDIQKKQEPLTLVRPAASLIDNFQEVTHRWLMVGWSANR